MTVDDLRADEPTRAHLIGGNGDGDILVAEVQAQSHIWDCVGAYHHVTHGNITAALRIINSHSPVALGARLTRWRRDEIISRIVVFAPARAWTLL